MYHFTHTLERDEDIDVEVTFEVHRGRFALTAVTHDGADLATTGDEDAELTKAAWRVYDDRDHAL
jgi:hypothetical protein